MVGRSDAAHADTCLVNIFKIPGTAWAAVMRLMSSN